MLTRSVTRVFTAIAVSALLLLGCRHDPGISASPPADQARITLLYDAFGKAGNLQKDWGFAAYVEYGGKRVLFDTGNNADIFKHNVTAMGIDLSRLDFAIVSHRHGDHTSGLNHLLAVNPKVEIFVPKENFGVFGAELPGTFLKPNPALPADSRYFDGKVPEKLHFGSPWPQGRFTWLTQTKEIAPGFHAILLKGSWGVDLDVMEISLAIDTPDGIVLIVGCGHPTIEKIVEAAHATLHKPIHLVVGGLHLLPASDHEISRIAMALHDEWKVDYIAPAHCTGEAAFAILQQVFGSRYLYAGLGSVLRLGPTITAFAGNKPAPAHGMEEGDLQMFRTLLAGSDDMTGLHPDHPSAGNLLTYQSPTP